MASWPATGGGCDALISHDHGRTWGLDRRYEHDRFDFRREDGYWVDGQCGHIAAVALEDGSILSDYGQYRLVAAVLIRWKPDAWPWISCPGAIVRSGRSPAGRGAAWRRSRSSQPHIASRRWRMSWTS